MNYQLDIQISADAVRAINQAGQKVTLVKSAQQKARQIAWVTFDPMQNNTVSWTEEYGLYATTTQLEEGAVIRQTANTTTPIQLNWVYTFAENVFDGGQRNKDADGAFYLTNADGKPNLSFGLTQTVNVQGTVVNAPLNAVHVLNGQHASFTPIETVSIYLSDIEDNGVVISDIASDALVVELTSANNTATIGFNAESSTFRRIASPMASAPQRRGAAATA